MLKMNKQLLNFRENCEALITFLATKGGGVVFDPLSGFSSVTFARGMISKRNFG